MDQKTDQTNARLILAPQSNIAGLCSIICFLTNSYTMNNVALVGNARSTHGPIPLTNALGPKIGKQKLFTDYL